MHYPHQQLGFVDSSATTSSSKDAAACANPRLAARRAASTYGEAEEVQVTTARPGMHTRAFSSIAPRSSNLGTERNDSGREHEEANAAAVRASNHPLSIDLRLGAPGSTSIPALMESMSQATIAQLLSARFDSARAQLNALHSRVRDNQSRILVTGDLNAGKSTFVNALLRRDILPTDQQPLTTVFCEVLDAQGYNDGVEEVHAILLNNVDRYDRKEGGTFDRFSLDKLDEIATDEDQRYGMVKVYLEDSRAPLSSTPTSVVDHETGAAEEACNNKSFIRNGIVSISLIDGPGLNRDTLSTTAVFARQSEIDVIVFVVSAENHFTLSAREFLWNASMEKAYVFVVVNKWQGIRDKKRCERLVGEQIRQLSPKTWENRDELVHFVEAANVIDEIHDVISGKVEESEVRTDDSFTHLEESLRSFLLLKRSISKLAPAKHYLVNLLSNITVVAEANIIAADKEAEEAQKRLDLVRPIHEKLEKEKEVVEEAVGREEEDRVEHVKKAAKATLNEAVEIIGAGGAALALPEYQGLLGIWDWAAQVKAALVRYIETQIVLAEDDARNVTVQGVKTVTGDLAKKHLPSVDVSMLSGSSAGGAASALPLRVFKPEIMFAKRRAALNKARAQQKSVDNLSSSSPDVEISLMDLFDLERLISLPSSLSSFTPPFNKKLDSGSAIVEASSALSVISLGAGALTMFGSRIVGLKSIVEAITTACEVLGSKAARKWAGPIAGVLCKFWHSGTVGLIVYFAEANLFALAVGLAIYIIRDLPRAIPYNVGRKLHSTLVTSEFSSIESERIAKETRKVMRLAGWDLRERFRAALEASEKDRKDVEGRVKKAEEALGFLEKYLEDVDNHRGEVRSIIL